MKPITLKGKYTNAVVMTETAESSCLDQIRTMIDSPAFDKPVVIMPDTHAGKGSVVGFTMPMGEISYREQEHNRNIPTRRWV